MIVLWQPGGTQPLLEADHAIKGQLKWGGLCSGYSVLERAELELRGPRNCRRPLYGPISQILAVLIA